MIDIWKVTERSLRLHHVRDGSKVGELHNEQHQEIELSLASLSEDTDIQKRSRALADAASRLSITAQMTGGDRQSHLREVVEKVNKFLPEGQKLIATHN